ncbi:MAG TPA: serine hydrolase [Terriglobales bacterium]
MKKVIAFMLLIASTSLAQSAPVAPTHTRDLLWQKLVADVTDVSRNFDGVIGITIRDLTDGRELAINADDVFPTASSIKIALLAELYRQSQTGQGAKLGDLYTVRKEDVVPDSAVMENLTPNVTRVTNRDLAGMVVAVSDNSATNVLIDRVGMDNVNRMLDSLGLHQMRLRRKMMDLEAAKQGRENISTPRDMAALLEALYRGKVLNKESTDDFFKLLSTGKDSQIPRLIPEGVRIANKPGALAGVRNDNGIVFVPNRPFVISVMTSYAHDERAAEQAISRVAEIAYRYFDMVGSSSDYGRIISPKNSR